MKDWRKDPVFVTGCTGFLGQWIVRQLDEDGVDVVGLVRDNNHKDWLFNKGQVSLVNGQLEDLALLERILNEYRVGTVIHLAAQTIVQVANHSPISTFESNIRGTWNLLEACRRTDTIERIIIASSDKAYGETKLPQIPYKEEDPLRGKYPYDVSKICVEHIAKSYYETYDSPISITRCSNIYGGGDLNFSRIVPATIRSLYKGERPIVNNGGMTRDYLYVRDAVEGYINLLDNMNRGSVIGHSFNFGNQTQFSAEEIVDAIMRKMNVNIEPILVNERKNEIGPQYVCNEKAKARLHWQPEYTLDQGLSETVFWYGQYLRSRSEKA